MIGNRWRLLGAALAVVLSLTGCVPTESDTNTGEQPVDGAYNPSNVDGPHAAPDRTPEATTSEQRGDATVTRFDLGNLDLPRTDGQPGDPFRTPVRGSIVTPSSITGPTQLISLAHLRYSTCVQVDGELVLAYPCRPAPQTSATTGASSTSAKRSPPAASRCSSRNSHRSTSTPSPKPTTRRKVSSPSKTL